jgi:hypothetical protein
MLVPLFHQRHIARMRRSSVVLLVLGLAQPAFAQIRLTNVVDAGTPKVLDGGMVDVKLICPPPPKPTPDPELERLRHELTELKALVARQAAQTDALLTSVEKVSKQVAAIRSDLADAEQRKADAKTQVDAQRASTTQAIASLNWATQQLSTGSANVGDALKVAEAAFSGAALKDVQNARLALQNGDLSAARQWLALAMAEAANTRD